MHERIWKGRTTWSRLVVFTMGLSIILPGFMNHMLLAGMNTTEAERSPADE